MKYRVKNQLNLFEFHDAEFSFVSFNGQELVVEAKYLNIHKNTEPNPSEYDMEIESARITFNGFHTPSYEPGRTWKTDADGKSRPVGPEIIYLDKKAEERIIEELQNHISVYEFSRKEDARYFIDSCGIEPFFTIGFGFKSSIVEWDQYRKKAWYELHKQYTYEITLDTPNGEQKTNLHILYHEEDVYYQGELEQAPTVSVGIKYQNKEIWGQGKDYLWVDAFADLQNQLPDGVVLKCCMTCRHGNMCPYGNTPDQLFCTKDVMITTKEDMCDLFDHAKDDSEIEKRTRHYSDICEDYQHQSWEHFTYSDYLYELDK